MKRSASGRRAPMLADHAERLLKCLALGSSESWKPHSAGDCSPTHEPPTRVLLKGGVESSQAETSALSPCFSHAASCASTSAVESEDDINAGLSSVSSQLTGLATPESVSVCVTWCVT